MAEVSADLHRRKDEFLAMLSHELRNPLAPIANAVHLLRLQQHEENPVQRQARAIIERQVAHLSHLVNDLLEVSRITAGRIRLQCEQIDVRAILERAAESVRPLVAQHRHQLKVELQTEPVWINADPVRMEQVIVNLLNNAAKYTEDGGRIWLRLRTVGGEAVVSVSDTGPGIPPDLLPRVFELFSQAERSLDRSQGGLGIGLTLVQRLVELHGGNVEAHSAPGKGSEFIVRLPLAQGPASERPGPEAATKSGTALRILVVDDNLDQAHSTAMLLGSSGHAVRVAHTGPTALDVAAEFEPDVVLLDIGLPELDGYEVARRLREQPRFRNLRLVAITGYSQESDRRRSRAAGFDHHLVKPVDLQKLQEVLPAAPIANSP